MASVDSCLGPGGQHLLPALETHRAASLRGDVLGGHGRAWAADAVGPRADSLLCLFHLGRLHPAQPLPGAATPTPGVQSWPVADRRRRPDSPGRCPTTV